MDIKNKESAAARLHQFVVYAKKEKMIKSIRNFEDECGLCNGYLNNALNASPGSIGSENISRIVEKFPMLNVYWLCTGKGNMLNYEGEEKEYKEVMSLISELQNAVKKMRQ
jgi:hypothetical protein